MTMTNVKTINSGDNSSEPDVLMVFMVMNYGGAMAQRPELFC